MPRVVIVEFLRAVSICERSGALEITTVANFCGKLCTRNIDETQNITQKRITNKFARLQ